MVRSNRAIAQLSKSTKRKALPNRLCEPPQSKRPASCTTARQSRQLCAQLNTKEAWPLTGVYTIGPGNPSHTRPFTTILVNVLLKRSRPLYFSFFGATPPIDRVVPSLKPEPKRVNVKLPDAVRSSLQLVIGAVSPMPGVGPGFGLVPLHLKVIWTPCSFPNGHPSGASDGRAVRLRLVPLGPVT